MSIVANHLDKVLESKIFTKKDWEKINRIVVKIANSITFPYEIVKSCPRLSDIIVAHFEANIPLINFFKIPSLLSIDEQVLFELNQMYTVTIDEDISKCVVFVDQRSITNLHNIWHSLSFTNHRSFLSDLIHVLYAYCKIVSQSPHHYMSTEKHTQTDRILLSKDCSSAVNVGIQVDHPSKPSSNNDNDNNENIQDYVASIYSPLEEKINKVLELFRREINVDKNLLSSRKSLNSFRTYCRKNISTKIKSLTKLKSLSDIYDKRFNVYIDDKISKLNKISQANDPILMDVAEAKESKDNDDDDDDDNDNNGAKISLISSQINVISKDVQQFLETQRNREQEFRQQQILNELSIAQSLQKLNDNIDSDNNTNNTNSSLLDSNFLTDNKITQYNTFDVLFERITNQFHSSILQIQNREILTSVLCRFLWFQINSVSIEYISNINVLILCYTLKCFIDNLSHTDDNIDIDVDSYVSDLKENYEKLNKDHSEASEKIKSLETLLNENTQHCSSLQSTIERQSNDAKDYVNKINNLTESLSEIQQKRQQAIGDSRREHEPRDKEISECNNKLQLLQVEFDLISTKLVIVEKSNSEYEQTLLLQSTKINEMDEKIKYLQKISKEQKTIIDSFHQQEKKSNLKLRQYEESLDFYKNIHREYYSALRKKIFLKQKKKSEDKREKKRKLLATEFDEYDSNNEKINRNEINLRRKQIPKAKRKIFLCKLKKGLTMILSDENYGNIIVKDKPTIVERTLKEIENQVRKHISLLNDHNVHRAQSRFYLKYQTLFDNYMKQNIDVDKTNNDDINWYNIIEFLAGKTNWEFQPILFQKFMESERMKNERLQV